MKLFTRFAAAALVSALPLLTVFAANTTVMVGDNFYRVGASTGNSVAITITAGDVVTWTNVGQGSHPTASDTGIFPTFPMRPGSPNVSITFNTPGVFGYYCVAHGAPGVNQFGTITVQRPTATEDSRLTGLALSLFPNPSKGFVTLTVGKTKVGTTYQLRLSNIIGQEVRAIALRPDLTEAGLPLDLRELPAGMYLCSLVADGKVVSTKRLILQN